MKKVTSFRNSELIQQKSNFLDPKKIINTDKQINAKVEDMFGLSKSRTTIHSFSRTRTALL